MCRYIPMVSDPVKKFSRSPLSASLGPCKDYDCDASTVMPDTGIHVSEKKDELSLLLLRLLIIIKHPSSIWWSSSSSSSSSPTTTSSTFHGHMDWIPNFQRCHGHFFCPAEAAHAAAAAASCAVKAPDWSERMQKQHLCAKNVVSTTSIWIFNINIFSV